jgi:hypothetical protein
LKVLIYLIFDSEDIYNEFEKTSAGRNRQRNRFS